MGRGPVKLRDDTPKATPQQSNLLRDKPPKQKSRPQAREKRKIDHDKHSLLYDRTKKEKSLRQERRVAKKGRGHAVPGSGNQLGKPGDVRLRRHSKTRIEDILVECKRTDNIGIYLSDKVLRKHESEAADDGKTPVFQVDMDGRKNGRRRWFLVPEELWDEFLDGGQ